MPADLTTQERQIVGGNKSEAVFQDPGVLRLLGMPTPSLEQYEHITGLGRDQYVRVVRRGYVHTGMRASIVKVTEAAGVG